MWERNQTENSEKHPTVSLVNDMECFFMSIVKKIDPIITIICKLSACWWKKPSFADNFSWISNYTPRNEV